MTRTITGMMVTMILGVGVVILWSGMSRTTTVIITGILTGVMAIMADIMGTIMGGI